MSDQDLVTIRKYGTPQEAHLARSVLDAAGFDACVTDESMATWMAYVGTALGGARVQVAERDAARAREVLREGELSSATAAGHDWICPNCAAHVDAGFDVCWSCETSLDESHGDKLSQPTADATKSPAIDDRDDVETPADADAMRAWRAALFGLFFPPLLLYSLYLVLKIMYQELSPQATRRFYGAAAISLLTITLLWTVFLQF